MSDKQIVLLCARHGTTVLNANGCFRGSADPPLDAEGFRDAHISAHYLSGIEAGAVYSSPRLRATQTAVPIAAKQNREFHELPDLVALDVGDFSGQPKSPENVAAIEHYIQNPDIPIPGGESLNEFRERVRPIFGEALAMYEMTGLPCLLVVHSSIIHELGMVFNNDHHSARVEPGGVAAVFCDEGQFHAEPIFKPLKEKQGSADTVS